MPETEKERLNRKLSELLQELRVALPGIQVLFAFLLILPFTGPFQEVSSRLRDVYFASLVRPAPRPPGARRHEGEAATPDSVGFISTAWSLR